MAIVYAFFSKLRYNLKVAYHFGASAFQNCLSIRYMILMPVRDKHIIALNFVHIQIRHLSRV